jgi:hypothetical protein
MLDTLKIKFNKSTGKWYITDGYGIYGDFDSIKEARRHRKHILGQ